MAIVTESRSALSDSSLFTLIGASWPTISLKRRWAGGRASGRVDGRACGREHSGTDGPAGGRPYELLRRGMDDGGVVAVAQVVLSGREQLVQVRTVEGLLVMQFLSYAKKVKGIDEFTSELSEQKTEARSAS